MNLATYNLHPKSGPHKSPPEKPQMSDGAAGAGIEPLPPGPVQGPDPAPPPPAVAG